MLSATAGAEEVVRIGWLEEAIAWRKQSNASDDVPLVVIVMAAVSSMLKEPIWVPVGNRQMVVMMVIWTLLRSAIFNDAPEITITPRRYQKQSYIESFEILHTNSRRILKRVFSIGTLHGKERLKY